MCTLRAFSATIMKALLMTLAASIVLAAIVLVATLSGITVSASLRWLVLRNAPEDATIPLDFDTNFRVSEGLGREWLDRLTSSVQQSIDAAIDEMPATTPLSRRALRIKAAEAPSDDDSPSPHPPPSSDLEGIIQALLGHDSGPSNRNALLLETLGGGASGGGGYQQKKADGGMGSVGGDLSVEDLMESSRSQKGRKRGRDGSASAVLGSEVKSAKPKIEDVGLLDWLWETSLAPASGRNFPFVEDTLPFDDALMQDSDILTTWMLDGERPRTQSEDDDFNALLEDSQAGPSKSSGDATCPLVPEAASCESCHKAVSRQSEHSRQLALELLKQSDKQSKLKLAVAARLVEAAVNEGKSKQATEAWGHVSHLIGEMIRLRSRAESAVEESMVAKSVFQLTDLTTKGSAFSFLRRSRQKDLNPLSLLQPLYILRAGTAYDIRVTLSARVHYRPDFGDLSVQSLRTAGRAECQHPASDSSASTDVLSWIWSWLGGDRLWRPAERNGHDRCGAIPLSYRDTQLVLHSGLVTSERELLAESSGSVGIRSLPLYLEGSVASVLAGARGATPVEVGILATFWGWLWDWCMWWVILPFRTIYLITSTLLSLVLEAFLWFSFGWLRVGVFISDRVARFVLGVPQAAPSLLHHYLHMPPPHEPVAPQPVTSGDPQFATAVPTIPLVGYAQNLVFNVASGFVPSSDLVSKLASIELLLLREVDSSTSTDTRAPNGTFPYRVAVTDGHITFNVVLHGLQYYFTHYPIYTFVGVAVFWGAVVGFGCLALIGSGIALLFTGGRRQKKMSNVNSSDAFAPPARAKPVRPAPYVPPPESESDEADEEEEDDFDEYGDDDPTTETASDAPTSASSQAGTSTPATTTTGSIPDLTGANRVWTPRPVRSRTNSQKAASPVDSAFGGEAQWRDVTRHRLGSEEGWARRSEDPPMRPLASGGFGGAVAGGQRTQLDGVGQQVPLPRPTKRTLV